MIIKRLTLYNFGIYAGENTFSFTGKKPVVLIGGLNGRGKTTFLSAILLSLYGDGSVAYKESGYKTYGQYLRSYVNHDCWDRRAHVEMEFVTTGSDSAEYMVRREWDALGKRTKELVTVEKNGEKDDFLTENWSMFVESILPGALAGFYFFDGEKIAEMAVDSTSPQLKESIRAMLGITVLDVLKNDLFRVMKRVKRKTSGNRSAEELEKLRRDKFNSEESLAEIDEKIRSVYDSIVEKKAEIEESYHRYDAQGGTALEKRDEINRKRAELQAEYAKNEENLLGSAASVLPMAMVSDLIADIKLTAQDEHNEYVLQQAVGQIEDLLDQFMDENHAAAEGGREFFRYLKEKAEGAGEQSVYGLSDQALFQVGDIFESKLSSAVKTADDSLSKKKEIKGKLAETDSLLQLDINEKKLEEIRETIRSMEEERVRLEVELRSLQNERSSVNASVITKTAEFNRYVEGYLRDTELTDDSDRTLKYSNLAVQIIDRYTAALQERKTGLLAQTVTECYKKLANKSNLIDRVDIDSETLEISYYNERGEEVEKTSLSAGEKQLVVVSILWALAICSHKKLPVIIDTPLSRLDSLHRSSLITTYFPQASEQTIILSTDSEIDRDGYELIKDNVGDEFTLFYDENEKSTKIRKGYYFREAV
ncbi:MAG: DNA sulfur modification protein DndD [Lachnospiraceae bacterium]|nr:DNA sulfur modification protein DndD [Lachnospiraceae bacterium]